MKKYLSLLLLCLMISACTSGNAQHRVQTDYEREWQPVNSNR